MTQASLDKQSVAVIGAGIIGINCALELQTRGYQVTLFDKNGLANGCSKGNAGHFATEQVFPLAQASLLPQLPKMLIDPLGPIAISPTHLIKTFPWFISFLNNMRKKPASVSAEGLKSLNENAINYYRPLLAEAGCQHLLTNNGALLVFESTPLMDIKLIQQQFLDGGVAVELLFRDEVLELEPGLSGSIQHALHFTDVAHTIEPQKLCLALAELAKRKGLAFISEEISHINPSRHNVAIKAKTDYQFDKLVIATGAHSKSLLGSLGYNLPIQAERGYHLELEQHQSISRPITSAERKFIMTPMESGLRLAGTVEYAEIDSPPNYRRAQMLKQNAQAIVDKLPEVRTNNYQWMGNRPTLPDSLPVISKASHHDNIYFAVGHQHLGLTQGAITGKLIGQIVDNEPTDIDISPFDISRFN